MDLLSTLIQAVVQGLAEFIPVSSSGHLSLVQHFFGIRGDESIVLSVALHVGTLVAVFIAFWPTIAALLREFFLTIRDVFTGKFKWSEMNEDRRLLMMLVIACVPLIPFYIIKEPLKQIASDNDIVLEGIAFLFTALALTVADKCVKGHKTPKDITVKNSLTVGLAQCVALVPGVSRSGMTISSGLLSGFSRETAVKFSFILGIPAIIGGSASELIEVVGGNVEINWPIVLIGMAVAAVVGFLSIKMVQWIVKTDKFRIFAIYTFALGIIVVILGILEHLNIANFVVS